MTAKFKWGMVEGTLKYSEQWKRARVELLSLIVMLNKFGRVLNVKILICVPFNLLVYTWNRALSQSSAHFNVLINYLCLSRIFIFQNGKNSAEISPPMIEMVFRRFAYQMFGWALEVRPENAEASWYRKWIRSLAKGEQASKHHAPSIFSMGIE